MPNQKTKRFSKCYDESWVEKLYRGFKRNCRRPFEFVLFVDYYRELSEPITQRLLEPPYNYGSCITPFSLGERSIIVGLDTIVTGDCDWLFDLEGLWLPVDPNRPKKMCNGVAVTSGQKEIFESWRGENDMDWLNTFKAQPLPVDKIKSFKGHVLDQGIGDASIVYFHGMDKPHEIEHEVLEHWL